jgi:predicted Fe-Mo cluster-binding NifX family protein
MKVINYGSAYIDKIILGGNMMKKVVIAKNGNQVSAHFGHCEGFEIFHINDGNVVERHFIESPGHRPGFLPVFLNEKGANVIIAGGMGETAQMLFAENGIEVVVGAQGDIDDVISKYMGGNLASSGDVCKEHEHHGEGCSH